MKSVSYIVPCYNNEQFVIESIASIQDQRKAYPYIEIVVVDDGSTDSSLEKIHAVMELDCWGRVVVIPKNKGVGAALNCGFDLASGDYLSFFSADDVIFDPLKTKCQVDVMEESGCDISYFLDRYTGADREHAILVKPTFVPCRIPLLYSLHYVLPKSSWLLHKALLIKCPINSGTLMIPREVYRKHGKWAEDMIAPDYDLLLRYAKSGLKFQPISGSPVLYRTHPGQSINKVREISESESLARGRNK